MLNSKIFIKMSSEYIEIIPGKEIVNYLNERNPTFDEKKLEELNSIYSKIINRHIVRLYKTNSKEDFINGLKELSKKYRFFINESISLILFSNSITHLEFDGLKKQILHEIWNSTQTLIYNQFKSVIYKDEFDNINIGMLKLSDLINNGSKSGIQESNENITDDSLMKVQPYCFTLHLLVNNNKNLFLSEIKCEDLIYKLYSSHKRLDVDLGKKYFLMGTDGKPCIYYHQQDFFNTSFFRQKILVRYMSSEDYDYSINVHNYGEGDFDCDILRLLCMEFTEIMKEEIKLVICDKCGKLFIKKGKNKKCLRCQESENPSFDLAYNQYNMDRYLILWKEKVKKQFRRIKNKTYDDSTYKAKDIDFVFETFYKRLKILSDVYLIRNTYLFFIFLYLARYDVSLENEILETMVYDIANPTKFENWNEVFFAIYGVNDLFIEKDEFLNKLNKQFELWRILNVIKESNLTSRDLTIDELRSINNDLYILIISNTNYFDNIAVTKTKLKELTLTEIVKYLEEITSDEYFDLPIVARNSHMHEKYTKYRKNKWLK